MISVWKTIRRPFIFSSLGVAAGLVYYLVLGCSTGTCAFASSPFNSMFFGGLMGLWISFVSKGGCCCSGGSCGIEDKRRRKK